MKHAATALIFLATFSPALAQNSTQLRACLDKAKTQSELTDCANQEAARANAELSAIYRKLLLSAAKQPTAVAKIKTAETAWIAYRDAYMNAMYPAEDKQAEYGSIFPMEYDLLGAGMTQRHIADLETLLKQHTGTGQ